MRHLPARLQLHIERFLHRGLPARLLLIAILIGAVAVVAGTAVWLVHDGFDELPGAIWWAFLRLTDPGYLGDDHGVFNRFISTVVTVIGYVLFMGLLVATMTQWLQQAFERLARGESPVFRRGHVLILGWTERTPEIVRELLISEGRVRRFLRSRRRFARGLHVVVMAEHPSPAHRDELRLALGERYSTAAYTLRAGDPLRLDHLERVAFPDAAAIVIPGAEAQRAGEVDSDTAAVKVLLSLAAHPAMRALPRPPRVVAEVFHPARVAVARAAWPGPVQIVCSDRLVGQLLARSVENPGLSAIVADLFTHDVGAEPYVASLPGLSGEPWARGAAAFDDAVPLGLVRGGDGEQPEVVLLPPADHIVQDGESWLCVARSFERCTPGPLPLDPLPLRASDPGSGPPPRARSVLMLGWNDGLAVLIEELAIGGATRMVHVSTKPAAERARGLRTGTPGLDRLELVDGDITDEADLRALRPAEFDAVVLLRSDRYGSRADADARTLVAHLMLRRLLDALPEGVRRPHVVVELAGAANKALIPAGVAEVVVSPLLIGNLLALVALRPAIGAFVDQLLSRGDPSLALWPAAPLLRGAAPTFGDLQRAAAAHGALALGVVWPPRPGEDGRVRIAPGSDARLDPLDGAMAVVLRR
jgi:hypothetical protein